MRHTAGNLEFDDLDSVAALDTFQREMTSSILAVENLRTFYNKAQNGELPSLVGVGQKLADAMNEIQLLLERMSTAFYTTLARLHATLDGAVLTRPAFDKEFNLQSQAAAQKLIQAVAGFISAHTPTEAEVKN